MEGQFEISDEMTYSDLQKMTVEERRQAGINIYEESKQTLIVYANGWQSRLKHLIKVVIDELVAMPSVV